MLNYTKTELIQELSEGLKRVVFREVGSGEKSADLITLTGMAPSSYQTKPLKPGSASIRLADALNVTEEKLKD